MKLDLIDNVLANPYIMAVLKITITLYAAKIAPTLPDSVLKHLDNTFVKIAVISLIVYISDRDIQLAIILSVLLVVGLNYVSGKKLFESFSNYSSDYTKVGGMKLLEPKSIIYPGCQNITLKEIYTAFDDDHMKLQNTIMYAVKELLANLKNKSDKEVVEYIARAIGLPHNLAISDENAPLLATLLMYYGFKVTDTCTAPN
jgi:hypothetical protein